MRCEPKAWLRNGRSGVESLVVVSILTLALLLVSSVPAAAAGDGTSFAPGVFPENALPPLPDPVAVPVQLVIDDDGAEGSFGIVGGSARQFSWLNRFDNPGPFNLQEIWVLFPSGQDVTVGAAVQLAVYLDPDGDPSNGAQLLATYDVTAQAADGNTFSVYPLSPELPITMAGDVLIGAVNRYFTTGVSPPPTRPAALDTTASQGRSYVALWAGDAPDPPDLGTATSITVLSGVASGNFMIRGFGAPVLTPPVTEVPVAGGIGLTLLVTLLALAAILLLRR